MVAGCLLFAGSAHAQSRADVVRLDLDTAVQPLSASYVVDGVRNAEADGADAVLLRIDTPGGTSSSMRRIVGAVLGAKIPVICWVGPEAARAASAGTFILLACHVATMAPGTNVGAAHPVGLRGEVLAEKITNDSAAFIRSIAEQRGRNAEWAETAVRESVSISAREAQRMDVIDGVVSDAAAVLRFAHERTVRVDGDGVRLDFSPVSVRTQSMGFGRSLLGSLIDPNLAYLLLLIGIAGIFIEILSPGFGVPGAVGLFSLLLSFVMLEMLPVNIAGVLLLLAGIGLVALEVHVPGFGVAGVGGTVSLVLGGLLLFDAGSLVRVSRPLVIGTAIGLALFILLVVGKVVRSRRLPPHVPPTMIGAEGVATSDLDPVGTVRVRSEEWTAESTNEPISAGTRVLVVSEDGLKLQVDAADEGRS